MLSTVYLAQQNRMSVPVSPSLNSSNSFRTNNTDENSDATRNILENDELRLDDSVTSNEVTNNILEDALRSANLNDSYLNRQPLQIPTIEHEGRIMNLDRSFVNIQNENYRYNEDIINLQKCIESLEKELTSFQQYNRRENIEISGIPESIPQNELEKIIIDVLKRIGVWGLESYEVVACRRLRRKMSNERTQRVIIRFTNRKRAIECLQGRRYLRDTIHEFPNIYIHESLCHQNKDIYEQCLSLQNNGNIRKLWTYNGTIYVKKTSNYNERPKRITNTNDIHYHFPDTQD